MNDDEKNVLTLLPKPGKQEEIAALVGSMRRNLPAFIEYHQVAAQMIYARYAALMKEGFNAEQALTLCRT